MDAYSNFATEQLDGRVSVIFERKAPQPNLAIPIRAIHSAKAVVRSLAYQSMDAAFGRINRLVGIPTRWKRGEKRIRGSSIAALLPMLNQLIGEVRQNTSSG